MAKAKHPVKGYVPALPEETEDFDDSIPVCPICATAWLNLDRESLRTGDTVCCQECGTTFEYEEDSS